MKTRCMLLALCAAGSALHAQATAPAPATAVAPEIGAPPRLSMPAVQTATLPNGLRLQLVEMREVPLVKANLSIEGGGRLDGDRPGLATFTANMLDEGAGARDAFAISAELEYLGADLSTGASWNATVINLGAPKRTFAKAMDLMADVLLRPTFTSVDVKRQRDLRLAGILQQRDQPGAVAALVFSKVVFPESHPYHDPLGGDSASTAVLDSAMVRDFWQRAADPRRATLVVTGDITLAEARALAAAKFGGWRSPARPLVAPAPAAVPAAPKQARRIVLVDKPGAAQSVVSIGAPGVPRVSADYAAITLMNTILGGSFSSRLNDVLREQKGYTYGAGSGYNWQPIPGAFQAGAQVRTNVTDSSLAIFFDEFRRMRDSTVSPVELERGRAYIALGALSDFETTGDVAGQLAGLNTFGLPLTTIPADIAAINRLTAADVQRAARTYIDPEHLTIVIVGDIATIRPGIEALNLGPIEVRDHNGNEVLR